MDDLETRLRDLEEKVNKLEAVRATGFQMHRKLLDEQSARIHELEQKLDRMDKMLHILETDAISKARIWEKIKRLEFVVGTMQGI